MEPEPLTKKEEGAPKSKLRLFIIVGVVFLLLALGIFYVVVIRGGGNAGVGLRSLLPFGNEASDVTLGGGGVGGEKLDDVTLGGSGGATLPRMFKIADGPVSGSVFKTLPDGSLAVRYVLREDGDVYEYSLDTRSGRILANNTIPRVAEAIWDARGQSVVLRTANDRGDIMSVLGRLLPNPAASAGDDAPAILEQSFLKENIIFLSPGPTEGFVYTLRVGNELSILLLDANGVPTPIFASPFTEWIPEWAENNLIGLTTRPSGLVGGYAFSLDPKSGATVPLLNDLLGLTTKSAPDGKQIFVGGAKKNSMTFGVITKDLPVPSDILPVTLPEKCAWTASSTLAYCGVPQNPPLGTYPDEWYQGIVQFSDVVWVYNSLTGQFALAFIPKDEAGVEVDITSPAISSDEGYMMFINKKDGSLWGMNLRDLPSPKI